MAEKKYDNHKCFVFSAGGYEEITYAELCYRYQKDKSYENKLFIPLHGMLMEVAPEQYKEFYKEQRRQKYLTEQSTKNQDISIDAWLTDNLNGTNVLVDSAMDVVAIVERNILLEQLREAISHLTEEEHLMICGRYYDELTETELAEVYGISQQAVSKRLRKILGKLRKAVDE
ncbi:MAG: sigma-70 family RNA polymerase sigma factor [Bacteroides sp.]|nr:sigma-70 family RNA polymerase sigma factor [Bacteroides sp.]MCM1548823.1 sigma-70 family RNA polymerase sigma factor [Clostridium sp.]